MTLRRHTPMKQSTGTRWPPEVREHVYSHQPRCIGTLAGMPGPCEGSDELDHIRASGAVGLKSKSIAVNGARLCGAHHRMKGDRGKHWRPRLITVVRALYRTDNCDRCALEDAKEYGASFHADCVDPCSSTCPARRIPA